MLRLNRSFVILVLAALLAGCGSPAVAPPATPVPPTATPTQPMATLEPTVSVVPTGTVQARPTQTIDVTSFQFSSKALEGNLLGDPAKREIFVYLPPSYETSNQRYPVVYVMPWGNGQSFSNVSGVTATMNELVRSGEVQEMILVFPDGSNRLFASLFRTSPTVGDYETYLTRELVDYVDNNYRTLVSRDSRGIAGCSNGGETSMRMALRYPNIFSVAAPSGGFYNNEPAGNAILQQELDRITTLPQNFGVLASWARKYPTASYFIQEAVGTAANPAVRPSSWICRSALWAIMPKRCQRSLPASWRETVLTRLNATSISLFA
jgi:enterochelin esterase-like enzyme